MEKRFVESAGSSGHADIRSHRRRNKRKAFYRDRTRGDGLAEISLENSTIAHLPALIRALLCYTDLSSEAYLISVQRCHTAPPAPATLALYTRVQPLARSSVLVFNPHRRRFARPFTPTRPVPLDRHPLIYPFPIRLPTAELPLLRHGTIFAFCGTLRPRVFSLRSLYHSSRNASPHRGPFHPVSMVTSRLTLELREVEGDERVSPSRDEIF